VCLCTQVLCFAMLFDRAAGQRIVSASICRSGQDASIVVQSLSVGDLAVRLPRPAVLRPARLAQERSPTVAGQTQHTLGRHVRRLRELSLYVLHVPLRLHMAYRSLHH